MPKYVCAFRGRRDSYQVPLALAESDSLDQFITDIYALDWVKRLAQYAPAAVQVKVEFRSERGIPARHVRCLWGSTVLEHLRHRVGYEQMSTFHKLDPLFSLAAASRAAHTRSDLFLYTSYAWEAFTARYSHTPRRILFQYHPHPDLENNLLAADRALYPQIGESYYGSPKTRAWTVSSPRERDSWKHADLILCASTFTKRSLLEAGADGGRCRVIPYGVEVPAVAEVQTAPELFQVVFVGAGAQRKGLHHLLLAWKQATLPLNSKLVLICRAIDQGIERLITEIPRVELRRGVTSAELHRMFASSTLFAMPSLVEGFGQVYLEALAQGCPVLGTRNSCLPDLGIEADGIFTVSPGNIDELAAKLEVLSRVLVGNREARHSALDCARRHPWYRFRETLKAQLAC